MGTNLDLNEPFGIPDGGIGSMDRFQADFIHMPSYFGGIARSLEDAGVRVVAGRMGAGKSLYLRMMREAQKENDSVYAESPARNLSDLSTSDVVTFSRLAGTKGANSETWKSLWRRAIFRAASSYILNEKLIKLTVEDETIEDLSHYRQLLGSPRKKRRVTSEAKEIITEYSGRAELRQYLNHPDWPDAESTILEAISASRPLFLYIDAIDDNFKWAPSYWMSCQRGLYYAIMDLLREGEGANRLHVVIALRDIVLGSTRASEHAPRYMDRTHINVLGWSRQSITEFLRYKVARLPDQFFADASDKSVQSWLSLKTIRNSRPSPADESTEDYLVRHTRGVPRDIIIMGNRLSQHVRSSREQGKEITSHGIRSEVAKASREFASSQLAQCANQVMSDAMPSDAVDHEYGHVYLEPNEYQMTEAVEAICACIRTVGFEEFGVDGLSTLNDRASDDFGTPVYLADILWQNGLIGWIDGDGVHFYSLDDLASSAIPRADTYLFHPILFDRIPGLRANAATVRKTIY